MERRCLREGANGISKEGADVHAKKCIIKFIIVSDRTNMKIKNFTFLLKKVLLVGLHRKEEERISILYRVAEPDRLLKPHFPAKMLKQLASDGWRKMVQCKVRGKHATIH